MVIAHPAVKPAKCRKVDPLRDRANVEFDRLNPIPFVPATTPHVAHQPHSRQRKSIRAWESRLAHHEALYVRWLRIYGRRFAADDPVKQDIRYWEARICRIDVRDWSAFFWFFGLGQIQLSDLCWTTRRCRDRENFREIPYRNNRPAQ